MGATLVTVHGLLITVDSLAAECGLWGMLASVTVACGFSGHGFQAPEHGLSNHGTQVQLLH